MTSLHTPRELISSLISSISTQTTSDQQEPASNSNPLRDASDSTQKALLTLHVLFPNELLPALDLLDRNLITRLKVQTHHEAPHQQPPQTPSKPQPNLHQRNANRDPSLQRLPPRELRQLPRLPPTRHAQTPRHSETQLEEIQTASQPTHADPPAHADGENLRGQTETAGSERHRGADVSAHAHHAAHTGIYLVRSGQQLPARLHGRAVTQSQYQSQQEYTKMYEVRLQAWNCSCPAFAFAAFPAAKPERGVAPEEVGQQAAGLRMGSWRFGGLTLGEDTPVCKHLLACVLVEYSSVFGGFVEEREVSVEELAGWAAGWGD